MALSNPQRHKEKLVQTTFIDYLTALALSRIPKQPEAIQRTQHQEKYRNQDSNLSEWMNSARSLDTRSIYKNTQKQKIHLYESGTNKQKTQ